jgi:hypothetical protein
MATPKISSGDLVRRKYHISQEKLDLLGLKGLGLVLERDNNGFLSIVWGDKIEYMWDDYDLVRVESSEEI